MDKILVNELLREYEKKRFQSEQIVENRMKELILKHKELAKIEEDIQNIATENIKSIFLDPKNKEIKLKELEKKLLQLQKQKESFIKKLKLPKDYLEVKYECERCKDTGFIKERLKLDRCPCLKQKIININYNKSNLIKLEEEDFAKFNLKYYSNKSDKEKYSIDKSPRENMEEIEKLSKDFVNNFGDIYTNLLFSGDTGLGKTYLINAISKEILNKGYTVFYQKAPIMLDKLMQIKYEDTKEYNALIESILNVDLLVIDDLAEKTTDSKNIELLTIIDHRLNNSKPTIISTNLTLEELQDIYEDRIISRIIGNYIIKRFYGEDIRKLKKLAKRQK